MYIIEKIIKLAYGMRSRLDRDPTALLRKAFACVSRALALIGSRAYLAVIGLLLYYAANFSTLDLMYCFNYPQSSFVHDTVYITRVEVDSIALVYCPICNFSCEYDANLEKN